MRILVTDVGGTHVKVLPTGHKQRVEIPTGPKMSAERGHIFTLSEASVSGLGYNHAVDDPVIQSWNNEYGGVLPRC